MLADFSRFPFGMPEVTFAFSLFPIFFFTMNIIFCRRLLLFLDSLLLLLFVFKISKTCEAIKMPLQEVEKENDDDEGEKPEQEKWLEKK